MNKGCEPHSTPTRVEITRHISDRHDGDQSRLVSDSPYVKNRTDSLNLCDRALSFFLKGNNRCCPLCS